MEASQKRIDSAVAKASDKKQNYTLCPVFLQSLSYLWVLHVDEVDGKKKTKHWTAHIPAVLIVLPSLVDMLGRFCYLLPKIEVKSLLCL